VLYKVLHRPRIIYCSPYNDRQAIFKFADDTYLVVPLTQVRA